MIHVGGPSLREELDVENYRYKKISDNSTGTEEVIWAPGTNKRLKIVAGTVSTTTSGTVEIKNGTTGDIIQVMVFGERKAVPFSIGFALQLPVNHSLSAKFTTDAGSGDCHITLFGFEI